MNNQSQPSIVERLRYLSRLDHDEENFGSIPPTLLTEAADEIAALRSKVEELTAARTVTELAVWEFIRELRYEGLIVSRNAFAAVEKMKAALTPSVNSQHSDSEAV